MQTHSDDLVQPIERWWFIAIGALQGFGVYHLTDWLSDVDHETWLYALTAGAIAALLVGPTLYFIARFDTDRKSSALTASLTSALFFVLWGLFAHDYSARHWGIESSVSLAAFLTACTFVRASHQDKATPAFVRLLLSGWSTMLALLTAFIVGWLIVGIIMLSATLIQYAGLTSLGNALEDWNVTATAYGAAAALILAIMAERGRLMDGVVQIIILSCRYIFLLFIALTVLTVFSFMVGGAGQIKQHLSVAGMCLSLSTTVYLIGLTGQIEPPKMSPTLRQLQRFSWLTVPPLIGFAFWASAVRIAEYGLTPDRIALIAACVLLAALAVGTCIGAITNQMSRWSGKALSFASGALAVFFVASLLPGVSWMDTSLRSQAARLTDGEKGVNPGAVRFLWFEAGQPGRDRLDTFTAGLTNQDAIDYVSAIKETSRWNSEIDVDASAKFIDMFRTLDVRPAGAQLPRDFLDGRWDQLGLADILYNVKSCTNGSIPQPCSLIVADILPDQPGDEVLLSVSYSLTNVLLFTKRSPTNRWRFERRLLNYDPPTGQNSKESGISIVEPVAKDIIIDGVRYGY